MNMLQTLNSWFSKPKVEDMVMNFVCAKLQTDHAHVLVTDEAMHPVYVRLASGLVQTDTGELIPIESNLDNIQGHEVILAHSTFNANLVNEVAQRSNHIILIVESFDPTALYQERLAEIERDTGCEIDFAFIKEERAQHVAYSPTESRYVGHKVRRIIRKRLLQ